MKLPILKNSCYEVLAAGRVRVRVRMCGARTRQEPQDAAYLLNSFRKTAH